MRVTTPSSLSLSLRTPTPVRCNMDGCVTPVLQSFSFLSKQLPNTTNAFDIPSFLSKKGSILNSNKCFSNCEHMTHDASSAAHAMTSALVVLFLTYEFDGNKPTKLRTWVATVCKGFEFDVSHHCFQTRTSPDGVFADVVWC